MGWASEAFWRDLGVALNSHQKTRRSARRTKEENQMTNYREIPEPSDLVRVCSNNHILGYTDKAIRVRIGQTLYGEPITTFYPKSLCQIRGRNDGGFDVYVPKWCNHRRGCMVGNFEVNNTPGFAELPF